QRGRAAARPGAQGLTRLPAAIASHRARRCGRRFHSVSALAPLTRAIRVSGFLFCAFCVRLWINTRMERLPGFSDFYPEPLPSRDAGWSADARNYIFDTWRTVAGRYGFREYDGPPLEPLELYTTKSGDEIVGQLYNFTDKGDRVVALRPEMTPTVARMVAAHARNYKKPIKWFAIPQLFRYERQQKGRLREHFQFNADIFGEIDPAADAELISLLIDSLRALKLTAADFVIRLSSRDAWQEFFERGMGQADASQEREYEFYQIIDKLER